jgi:putative hemolysin
MPFQKFLQKVPINIENVRYLVKTISTNKEFKEVLKLRYEIFYEELMKKKKILKIDKDKFDANCDHLVIIDRPTNKIVGTYRLNCSLFNKKYYSSTEFNIKTILDTDGVKVELGRACIKQEHRKNSVIVLLWRGIVEYSKVVNAKCLFGVSSVKDLSEQKIVEMYKYFRLNHYSKESLRVIPKKKFKIENLTEKSLVDYNEEQIEEQVPNLIKFYLKAGSKICGEPAYDKKMKCYDFFTLLIRSQTSKSVEEKFFK